MEDHADVVGRPPATALAALAVGVVLHLVVPVEIVPGLATWVLGIPVAIVSLALFLLSVREFSHHGTPVRGTEPVTAIVATGPYRFSRNPIYLSFVQLQLGIALTANSVWILLMVIPTVLYLSFGVIDREESYLARKFGDEYRHYRQSVRRWI
jgi:protein-S-isoprenylcysteine O-methyltransferase Ste14